MGEKTQINLQVDLIQKARWERYSIETRNHNTLSDLIRASVEAEIGEDESSDEPTPPALTTDVQDLKAELKEVRSDVSWIRKQFLDDDVISDLAQDVFDSLEPLHPQTEADHVPESVDMDLADYQEYLGAQAIIELSGDDGERSPQTARALADRLGVGPSEIEEAIDHLQDQFLPVVEVEYQGKIHYFKEA